MHDARIRPELHSLMPGKPRSVVRSLLIVTAVCIDRDRLPSVEPRRNRHPGPSSSD